MLGKFISAFSPPISPWLVTYVINYNGFALFLQLFSTDLCYTEQQKYIEVNYSCLTIATNDATTWFG